MPIKFEDFRPETLEEAVAILYGSSDEVEKKFIAREGVAGLHHGFGTALRNHWCLWAGSRLADYFKNTYGLGLEGLFCRVIGFTFNPEKKAEKYKSHWLKMNIDPLTQEKIDAV